LTLNGLHGVITQKMIVFITTAVRTSNPTCLFIFLKIYEEMLGLSEGIIT
jgi:hypothetical protein